MISLSVLLITFNNEDYIEVTLKSILKQNVNFRYEIVVGDDSSTDKTLEIIKFYSALHPHLFNIKKNNIQLGILKNYKTTLDRCKGNYIFDIAGDDILKSDNAFQKMVDVLKTDTSLGFVDSGYDQLKNSNNTRSNFANKLTINALKESYKEYVFLGRIRSIGVCYNRNLLYKFVNFDLYLKQNITIEDYPILVDLIMNTNFARINESLHIYRVHDESYSHNMDFEKRFFLTNQMFKLFNYFKVKYSFSESIDKTYIQIHYKQLLFLAGYFEKKSMGKAAYKHLDSKGIYIIHYLASQYPIIRSLIRLRKKIIYNLKHTEISSIIFFKVII